MSAGVLPNTNIESFLRQNEEKELLRLSTAGSVDDGKSTLIGRLLYDSKGVYEDQIASARKPSVNQAGRPAFRHHSSSTLSATAKPSITTARTKFISACLSTADVSFSNFCFMRPEN